MTFLIRLIALLGLSLFAGVGSAWYMIDNGAMFLLQKVGPWESWANEGQIDADPYTLAHMARSGRLPITAAGSLYFTAHEDSDGDALDPGCDYEIAGRPFNALWWSVAIYNQDGSATPNKAGRYSFNSKNVALLPDGSFRIRLAPTARPGNWLPTTDNDNPLVVLRIIRPLSASQTTEDGTRVEALPRIKLVECL